MQAKKLPGIAKISKKQAILSGYKKITADDIPFSSFFEMRQIENWQRAQFASTGHYIVQITFRNLVPGLRFG